MNLSAVFKDLQLEVWAWGRKADGKLELFYSLFTKWKVFALAVHYKATQMHSNLENLILFEELLTFTERHSMCSTETKKKGSNKNGALSHSDHRWMISSLQLLQLGLCCDFCLIVHKLVWFQKPFSQKSPEGRNLPTVTLCKYLVLMTACRV